MISHLSGILARKNEADSTVEIDVNGVWYEVELPAVVWHSLLDREVGEPLALETFYFVTANAPIPRLIGFLTETERDFFRKLVTVPNVGPTTATKALVLSVPTIAGWIEAGDTASLSRLPSIGKRTAETIVAQLRGKVTEVALLTEDGAKPSATPPSGTAESPFRRDAVDALVGLGYARSEADRLVQEVEESEAPATLEDVIRTALRRLNRV
jgi:holliday junction DNA helicase RuvA